MFDLHTIHAIKNGIHYYTRDRLMFDALFPAVSDNMKARMFQFLTDNPVSFDGAYTGSTAKTLPLVTVELVEAYYDSQGIGNMAHQRSDADGRVFHYYHQFTSQEVRINVYCNQMEGLRAIHRLIQASMLLWKNSFIKAGYENLLFTGTTPLVPEPRLEGEGRDVYSRQLRYAALHLLEIPAKIEDLSNIGALEPLLDVEVFAEDTTADSGVQGRVSVDLTSDS
jgi:hypothetical protein